MAKKAINKIFLFPFSLIVIFFSSLIIIFSPVGNKNIIKITPTITPTPISDQITWETYTNSTDNYQISYPSTWKLTKEAEKIILEKPDYARISIDSSNELGITLPIKIWISKYNSKLLNDPNRHPAASTINLIDNDNVLKNIPNVVTVDADFFGQGGKEYIFSYNKKIFSITGIYFVEDLPNEERIVSVSAEINEILSTFKFLPDTSNWKTYKNEEHSFEFKYPSNLQNIEKYSQNEYYITSFTSSDIKYTKSPLDTDIVSIGTEYSIFFDNKKCNVWSNGFGIYGYGIFHKNTVDSFPANVSYQGPSNNTYRLNIDTDLGCVSLIGEYGENTIDKSKIEFDQILSTFKFTK